ncbi:hypothetical protein V8C86DRAFT_719097 [Haematococcus lacustris]
MPASSSPAPKLQQGLLQQAGTSPEPPPDQDRVILHFDVDAFYAQCEELRDPRLQGRPLGVSQKYLVVTCNYPARAAGVGKLMSIVDAKRVCPDLILVPGEDLTPYRAASKRILQLLSRYGPCCRLGLDEVFVDITHVVLARLRQAHSTEQDGEGSSSRGWAGWVHQAGVALTQDSAWRPQDLRVAHLASHTHPTPTNTSATPPTPTLTLATTPRPALPPSLPASVPTATQGAASSPAPDAPAADAVASAPAFIPSACADPGAATDSAAAAGQGHQPAVDPTTLTLPLVPGEADNEKQPGTGWSKTGPGQGLVADWVGPGSGSRLLTQSGAGGGEAGGGAQQSLADLAGVREGGCQVLIPTPHPPWVRMLQEGSQVAQEARARLASEVGFRCSAGIAANRALAKLCSGLHKPDAQTILLPSVAADFVAPLSVRALPGVGFKIQQVLQDMGVATAAQLRRFTRAQLGSRFGSRLGGMLWGLCRGLDPTPVTPQGPPKSVTTEDSFKACSSLQAAEVLVPDLVCRLCEEYEEHQRLPHSLTLKWRHQGEGAARCGASGPMPPPPLPLLPQASHAWLQKTIAQQVQGSPEHQWRAVVLRSAQALLRQHLKVVPTP